jgi:hypothetical protein
MRQRFLGVVGGLATGVALTFTNVAWAQAAEPAEAEGNDAAAGSESADAAGADTSATGDATTTKKVEVTDPGAIESEAGGSPFEKEDETYYFVGLRYRGIIVPKFMMNLFGDGGSTVYVDNIGPEFAIRKNDFEYVFAVTYADYGMDPTPFKATSDPDTAWEIVSSDLNVLYATVDFIWTSEFSPQFGMNFGLGAGFGVVWGDLNRVQAYPDGSGGYSPCAAQGIPNGSYCGSDNDHYGDYSEPSWTDGGSKPVIFPWLAPMIGFRYKPHRHVVGRLDAGFGISGFFVGLGADYGI